MKTPASVEEAHRVVAAFVEHYNNHRLHSAIDYVTPADRLAGRPKAIVAARDTRLEAAREHRAAWRQGVRDRAPQPRSSREPLACSP